MILSDDQEKWVLLLEGPPYLLFHRLECRNLPVRVEQNFKFLRAENFIGSGISLLVSTVTWPGVVELVQLSLE